MSGLVPLANVITDFRKSDGTPNAGGTLEFFENLTLTPKDVFNGYNSTTVLANPFQLDAAGFEPGIWLGDGAYRIRCRETAPTFPTTLGAVIWTKDNVQPEVLSVIYNYTTATTLTVSHNNSYVFSTADITLPSAGSAESGWSVNIKNVGSGTINIARSGSGNSINGVVGNFVLPKNASILVVVNPDETGFDIFSNGLLQVPGSASGYVMGYGSDGPEWQAADLNNSGSDLYLYSNFT